MLRKKTKYKIIFLFILITILSMVFACRFFWVANELTRAQAMQVTTDTVNKIANEFLSKNGDVYSNILVKDKSSNGNISAINTDIEKINRLQTDIASAILHGLSVADGLEVKIPFGNILGLPVLLNVGPKISYKIAPVSNVHVHFEDTFKSAGINQTQFSVNLLIDTEVLYSVSAYQDSVSVSSTLPVVQLVLIGDIPNNYANIHR